MGGDTLSMSAPINETRLSELLTASGFRIGTRWYGGYAWNRWNALLGVSEWILIGVAGKKRESVATYVGVGVTRVLAFNIQHRLLTELADSKEIVDKNGFWLPGRGRAVIKSIEMAMAWERKVLDVAPIAAEIYAREHGDEILKRTASARQESWEILSQLQPSETLYQSIQQLRSKHGGDLLKKAERLAEWPGVMQVEDSEDVYLLACCGIMSRKEGDSSFVEDPIVNEELMWQIQLVVDRILLWLNASTTRPI